jgi:pSer/pThr/pTyr-binding forkhead associated (FHA) protein
MMALDRQHSRYGGFMFIGIINLRVIHRPAEGRIVEPYRYRFDKDEVLVGRAGTVDVRLPHRAVSLVHVRLQRLGERVQVLDEGSTNGSFLDGARLEPGQPAALELDSTLSVGPFDIVLERSGTERVTSAGDSESYARKMARNTQINPAARDPFLQVTAGPDRGLTLTVPLVSGPLVVGREDSCQLALTDADVSRRHLELRRRGDRVEARDLGSKNGILLDGQPVQGWQPLRDGHEISLGESVVTFRDPTEAYLSQVARASGERSAADADGAAKSGVRVSSGPARAAAAAGAGPRRRWELMLGIAAGTLVLGALGLLFYLLGAG